MGRRLRPAHRRRRIVSSPKDVAGQSATINRIQQLPSFDGVTAVRVDDTKPPPSQRTTGASQSGVAQ